MLELTAPNEIVDGYGPEMNILGIDSTGFLY